MSPYLKVQIADAGNFTVEIRRLRSRPLRATASHYRDIAFATSGQPMPTNAVRRFSSAVAWPRSAKTRRNYGQAQQASKAGALRPLAVTVERSIKSRSPQSHHYRSRGPVRHGLKSPDSARALVSLSTLALSHLDQERHRPVTHEVDHSGATAFEANHRIFMMRTPSSLDILSALRTSPLGYRRP